MAESNHVKLQALMALMDALSEADSPHFDLSSVGLPGLSIGVKDLHAALLSLATGEGDPLGNVKLTVSEGSTSLVVERVGGGAMVSVQGVF